MGSRHSHSPRVARSILARCTDGSEPGLENGRPRRGVCFAGEVARESVSASVFPNPCEHARHAVLTLHARHGCADTSSGTVCRHGANTTNMHQWCDLSLLYRCIKEQAKHFVPNEALAAQIARVLCQTPGLHLSGAAVSAISGFVNADPWLDEKALYTENLISGFL